MNPAAHPFHVEPIDVDAIERCSAWARRDGSLLLHDAEGGTSALLFAPRWRVLRELDGSLQKLGPVPNALPLDGSCVAWPARWLGGRPASSANLIGLGIAGLLSYEAGRPHDAAMHAAAAPIETPECALGLYDRALLFRPGREPSLAVFDPGALDASRVSLEARWQDARAQLIDASAPAPTTPRFASKLESLDREAHRRAVLAIHDWLRAGDSYQINLTGSVVASTDVDPWQHFLAESMRNPVGQSAWLRIGDRTVTSHSPERLLRVRGGRALSSPIKGTAPIAERAALRESTKDRAEHVMIVDLVRNDLGRVAHPGSVRVRELFEELPLRGLVHLVSHVEADLRDDVDALSALFPGGSITGAPKRRAMEIIAEVESHRRGAYTGSIGYRMPTGDEDWNISIRTAVWHNRKVAFGCGGGIVLDSDPDREYEEAMLKARSFFDSLRALERAATAEDDDPCTSISTEA